MRTPAEEAHTRCRTLGWCFKDEPHHEYIREHAMCCMIMSVAIENARALGIATLCLALAETAPGDAVDLTLSRLGISLEAFHAACSTTIR